MAIAEIHVAGYRSVRDLRLPLGRLNLITGPNGCGKSNLYRAVWLLHNAASGEFARSLADEGGMSSLLWAGPRRKGSSQMVLSVSLDDGFSYELTCGLPEVDEMPMPFRRDPSIKSEVIHYGRSVIVDRGKSGAALRDQSGENVVLPMSLVRSESILTQISDPRRFPVLSGIKETLLRWRFHHGFRTDADAPMRHPRIGVYTPALASDGRDLAAALATILEVGDAESLHAAVDEAFGGARLSTDVDAENRFRLRFHAPGLIRPLEATELSDGTIRFLCLLAALLAPRMPPLLALNEPETSLHVDVLPALARLIAKASESSQLWVVTHSEILARTVSHLADTAPIALRLSGGETRRLDDPF
ncbi:MAG: AAA family ATPase [Armatimonadota bacterium]